MSDTRTEIGWTLLPKGLIWYWMAKAASGTDVLFCTESLIADMERKFGTKIADDGKTTTDEVG